MKINNSDDLKDYIIELMKDKNVSKQHNFIYDNELIELTGVERYSSYSKEKYFDWLEYDTLYMITPSKKSTRDGKVVLYINWNVSITKWMDSQFIRYRSKL